MMTEGKAPTPDEQVEVARIEGELFRALDEQSRASKRGVIAVLGAINDRRAAAAH